MALITPRAIPVNFFGSGKASNQTYEFYNPSALARQLAFGQLSIALCYANVIKPREIITSLLEWTRVAQLPLSADTDADLSEWVPALFITQAYKQWWEEWKEHLFYRSALTYHGMIDPQYKVPDNTVSILIPMFQFLHYLFQSVTPFLCRMQVDDTPPSVSRSGKPIELSPPGPISSIGNNAPTLAAIMHRGVRLKKVTTKRTKTSPSVAASALAQAFKVSFQISLPISFFHLIHLYSRILTLGTAHWRIGKDQKHRCRCPPIQPGKEERLQEQQIASKAPEDGNTSSSPSVSNSSRIFSLLSRSPDATGTISSAVGRSSRRRIPTRGTSARRYIG